MVYQATEQPDAAARILADMTRITPTPESYALAAKLYAMFGDRQQAEAVRAEARRLPGYRQPQPLNAMARRRSVTAVSIAIVVVATTLLAGHPAPQRTAPDTPFPVSIRVDAAKASARSSRSGGSSAPTSRTTPT